MKESVKKENTYKSSMQDISSNDDLYKYSESSKAPE